MGSKGSFNQPSMTKGFLVASLLLFALSPSLASPSHSTNTPSHTRPSAQKGLPLLGPEGRVKIDFRNASIDSVLQFFSVTLGSTIIKDPSLTGTVTLISPQPITLREAFSILQAYLESKGYQIEQKANYIQVKRREKGSEAISPYEDAPLSLRVFPLRYASAESVARIINDLFLPATDKSQNSENQQGSPSLLLRATGDTRSNMVAVSASTFLMPQIEKVIQDLDTPGLPNQQTKVFNLKYVSAEKTAEALNELARKRENTADAPASSISSSEVKDHRGITLVPHGETNRIMVSGSEEQIQWVAQLLQELDKPLPPKSVTVVRTLQNASALEIARLLREMYGPRESLTTITDQPSGGLPSGSSFGLPPELTIDPSLPPNVTIPGATSGGDPSPNRYNAYSITPGGSSSSDNFSPSTSQQLLAQAPRGINRQIRPVQFPPFPPGPPPVGQQQQQARPGIGRTPQGQIRSLVDLTGNIIVAPDVNTNSLIITTEPANLPVIEQLISSLDVVPEQVLIEALIVEATLDKTNKLGFQFQFTGEDTLGIGGSTGTANVDVRPPSLTGGLQYTIVGSNFQTILQAIKTDRRFKVLATPRIFTANNRTAQISIGQQVPFITAQIIQPTGTQTTSFAFLDVGIILNVTPYISRSGYVTINVIQMANDFQGFTAFNAPLITQRATTTTVTVKDGQTVILGGLIRNSDVKSHNKVPILGDLPLIGNLFRSVDRSTTSTELMIFLTPRVVRTTEEVTKLTQEQRDQLHGIKPPLSVPKPEAPSAGPSQPTQPQQPSIEGGGGGRGESNQGEGGGPQEPPGQEGGEGNPPPAPPEGGPGESG